jgi:ADP-ribose pyrophosphatase
LKNGVSVLPLTADNKVYLVKRYRYATNTVGLELVTGAINEGETPLEAAKRELCEELKLETPEWIELGSVYPFPDKVDQQESLFIAKSVKLSHQSLSQDSSEDFNVEIHPFEQVVEWVTDGTIDHALSSITVMKAARLLDV